MKKKVYYKLNRYKVAKVEVESVEQEQAVKILNRETDRFAKSEDTYYCNKRGVPFRSKYSRYSCGHERFEELRCGSLLRRR